MNAAHQLGRKVGRGAACRALRIPRASLYRYFRPAKPATPPAPRPSPPRALTAAERQQVIEQLYSERFRDKAPEIFATLLDEGTYLCSVRTMYRILEEAGEVRERRDQLRHTNYQRPQLLATGSNQVWSWDITKLLGPVNWTYFYLYVILDIFSRYVVGWMVADRESAELAKRLIGETCRKQGIGRDQLTIHAARGTSMTSQPVALLMADLGVTKTQSRPHVSDDNPFSEAQFKILKYRPEFPERFGSIQDARLLPDLLSLVQHRAPPRRHWPTHARSASLRPGRRGHRAAPDGPQPGLRTESRTLRPGPSSTTGPAHGRLD